MGVYVIVACYVLDWRVHNLELYELDHCGFDLRGYRLRDDKI